ncbi:hypothetical protein M9H77_35420 [Catharanthus roseus]|uniref:Uncharacterized protein n=1 Tax=Catharanthus roseus TaxID=4058 RepID=A0ACB9ZP83_CATRO|nr:hypothetical protein M9H77_35420 [Catharanthus roseus]
MKVNTYLIVTRYLNSRKSDRRPYVTLGCERGSANKLRKKPVVDDEEEEVQVKRRGPYRTKKCGCLFKGKQIEMCENWQVFVHDGKHNHCNSVQKIYNVVAKIKKNRMQGRNTVEEVLFISAKWDYTVFYRNREDNNVLSDNVLHTQHQLKC